MKKASEAKADAAWERLQRGESFAAVAESVSEDMTSRHKGGYLGYTDRLSYGREFAAQIAELPPDTYGRPFASPWGYHIVKWEPMDEDDVVEFCESYLVDREQQKLLAQIVGGARVERARASNDGQ